MTDIIDLLTFEEGFRSRPYLDTEHFPTVGIGFLLAKTKCTPAELKKYYDFELPEGVAKVWLRARLYDLIAEMRDHPAISPAYAATEDYYARRCVLISMCYQLGVNGLASFKNTLKYVADGQFDKAAANMLKSKWAKQTPNRARRHAEQMKTGKWCEEYAE